MAIHVALHHLTSYRYDRPIKLGPQSVRLRPAPHCRTRILSYSLDVRPAKHFLNWQQDPQSNYVARLVFPDPTTELEIEIDLVVEMEALNPFDFFLEPAAEKWPFVYETPLAEELAPYVRVTESPSPRLDAFVASIPREARITNDFLVELNQRLAKEIRYCVRFEPGLQTPEETLEKASGSCRDSGWLLVQIMRRLGVAARFVSGYLIQLTADVKPLDGPEGPTADFVDLHAWCEVYLPGAGWIGLDPTSGLLAGEGHLPLACTAEPSLAAPVSGLVDRCETRMDHQMKVTRILETPRVTKPYSDAEWASIEQLGRTIDASLVEGDVRLTMGGEPTFVSQTDLDADEWNTAALGPTKRALALGLFERLREKYAPNGLIHFGQGKWYPGEPLPRWSLAAYFRVDGEPLWKDPSLAREAPAKTTPERLLGAVATHLGLDPKKVFFAHEDAYYYLWRERRLPVNVDVLDAKLDDPLERERLRRLFSGDLGAPAGAVLPLAFEDGAFRTSAWHFRGGACFLVPGDSPIGLRLPLDAQPWVKSEDKKPPRPYDPSEAPPPLPAREALEAPLPPRAPASDRVPAKGESATWVVRSAMCAEIRGGVLYVFMPPLDRLDEYVALASAVEVAARTCESPVVLEGYPPPRDPRVVALSVTPDPGVVEVNVQPVATWDELVASTTFLYEAARQSRLSAEKFSLDGRHVGTGGGNHVVLGGRTPNDSPFLRRPDLLRSLIAYFHQHPSLSFLFSGLFIGPTSQAPRVDEARDDALFEIEIAFRELTRKTHGKGKTETPPWLVDRLFRDLLVDVTGNTHRAEFCIDKLFSPDGSAGRLGLLELRGFEMPPHARMSLVQQLLLRALVARFWKEPYAPERLTRWGTALHDRFMLPYFVWMDFEDVVAETARAGIALRTEWFLPHFEFRFPKIGDVELRGIDIELRTALEPWHVMGEDVASGGTARYVDSSVERLQVLARGMTSDRYAITCNGHPLPLVRDGAVSVAGVRYRAWQPPRCLHPHIGVHTPLVFDLVDRWTERSLGGCEVHVSHPGGRNYDKRPVNALEAEGRRRARFFRIGHTPGTMKRVDPPSPSPDFPFTLDLRTR